MKKIKTNLIFLLLITIFSLALSVCPASAGDSEISMTLTPGTTWENYLELSYSGSITGGNASSWSWDFGDGSTDSILESGTHTYEEAGTYTVTLTVTSSDSTVTNSPDDTIVISEPTLVASADIETDSETLTVTYESTTEGAISWSWDFGDGSTDSILESGTHTYEEAGTYTITLTATSPEGNTDADAEEVSVTGPLPESTIAIDTLTASGTTWTTYNIVSFAGSISNGTASSWNWDFGDSSTDAASGSGTHTYSEAGTYTVTLTVTSADSDVSNSPFTDTITITEPPLVASFDIDLDDEELDYASTTTGAESWVWDFDDGSTDSTLESGTHIYTEPGDYTVTLTATSPAGNTSTYTEDIELNMLMAYFTADTVTGGVPLTVTFEDASSENPDTGDDIVEWEWDFDDGSSNVVNDDDSDVEHTFDDEGTYTVTLTVTDEDDDTDSYELTITVDDDSAPTADFD
ncbi:MAG: PKD domain-containing protein, partial [Methanomicrobiaceae archaeon]|nr:PKD domain-containing protein [Methanomicrobiaceae archaeon]